MTQYRALVRKVSISPEKKTKQKDYLPKGQLPIIDQGQQLIGGYTDNLDLQLSCNLPVIVFGDHTRAVKYVDFPFGAGADGIKVLEPAEGIYPKFLYYATQYLVLRLEDRGYARHYQYIEKKELDIPTVSEQKCIVARIEELFSELDNGMETLRKTKQQLAVYRQAVLKDVFDGAVGCGMGTIQSVCSDIVDCPHSTPKWTSEGKICLRTTNFKRGYLDLSEKNYVSDETFDKRNARLVPMPGDVLYSREGAILGIACIIPDDLFVCLGQRMMLLRTNEKMLGRFLMHYLNSPKVTSFVTTKIGGSASPHVNVGDIKNFIVPIPSVQEQEKMLEQIESRLSVCDSIEKTVDTALQQAEAMRQSILKKAFTLT